MNHSLAAAVSLCFFLLVGCGGSVNEGSTDSPSSSSSSSSGSSSSSSSSSGIISGSDAVYGDTIFNGMPDGMRISADGRVLERSGFFTRRLFNESYVETVQFEFEQSNYWDMLEGNYDSGTPIPATVYYRDNVLEDVGVRFRGATSYRSSGEKKSFNADLEWMIDGQSINSYNSLKLNNAFEDPSAIRNVVYSNLARRHIPAAKANFVNLVVNDRNFGVYTNIQKLNKDHAKEWFLDREVTRWRAEQTGGGGFGGGFGGCCFGGAFGAGTSSLNDLGADGSNYESAYHLKHSSVDDPWQDLANAAHTLGVVSPDYLVEQLGEYLDIDATLWFLATENIFTDDDSYINKGGEDYYWYFDIASGRMVPIEYDGNTALNTRYASSWGPFYNASASELPLLSTLLSIPELRQRYLAHYRTVMEDSLDPQQAHALIDTYVALIEPYMAAQSVRDYSYDQFQNGVQDVKDFFTARQQFLGSNSEVNTAGLTIADVQHRVDGVAQVRPSADDTVQITAQVSGAGKGVGEVRLYYGTGLMGRFERLSMTHEGDNLYTGSIPAFVSDTVVRYYIEAIADDQPGTASFSPRGAEHNTYLYQVQLAERVASPIVINELMASNTMTATDDEGGYGDWIELYNNSSAAVDVSGWYLTDKGDDLEQWSFPAGSVIAANASLVVWADNEAERLGGLHASFALSAGGESVYLVSPDLRIVDLVDFGPGEADTSYARMPNGTGAFGWTDAATFNTPN